MIFNIIILSHIGDFYYHYDGRCYIQLILRLFTVNTTTKKCVSHHMRQLGAVSFKQRVGFLIFFRFFGAGMHFNSNKNHGCAVVMIFSNHVLGKGFKSSNNMLGEGIVGIFLNYPKMIPKILSHPRTNHYCNLK